MIWKASLVLCLASGVLSYRPAISEQKIQRYHNGDLKHIGHHEPEHHEVYAWAYPSYEFSYHVDDPYTHDMKGQHEIRDGDKVTGDYWLMQPDGRKRTVKYKSDHKNGFHAEVKYSPHEAHHPYHHEEHHPEVKKNHHEVKEHHEHQHHHKERKQHHDKKEHHYEVKERHEDHHDEHRPKNILSKLIPDSKHQHDDKKHDESWGWMKPRSEHKHGHMNHRDDIHGMGHRQSEHWKHGVLVGWRHGRDHGDDDHHSDMHHQDHHDHHEDEDEDEHHKDRHHHHDHEEKRNRPYVPYGRRLH